MRRFLLTTSVSALMVVLAAAGCTSHQRAWDYKVQPSLDEGGPTDKRYERIEQTMDELGSQGWEYVGHVTEDPDDEYGPQYHLFKRPQ